MSLPFSDDPPLSAANGTIVPLWDGPAPEQRGTDAKDIPRLWVYLPTEAEGDRPAIVIMPGGGYSGLAFEHEGINEALWFQRMGVAAFVLIYRLPVNGYRHPVPLMDARRAVRLIRSRAVEWKIDPARVAVMGFSAGGHLASTLATHFDAGSELAKDPVERISSRPDFAALIYPVITLKTPGATHEGSRNALLGAGADPALLENLSNETQVTTQTPPTLLVHALDDGAVPIENSRLMLAALRQAGVPADLHEYPTGEHGFGFGVEGSKAPAGWLDEAYAWLREHGL